MHLSFGRHFRLVAAGIVALMTASSFAASAQDTLSTSKVVASSSLSQTLQGTPLQKLDHLAIEQRGMNDLVDAVRSFAGVNIRDYGGIGGIKTVSVRSLGAQHTAVAYDGITISNVQSGQVDISRFSLDNVDLVSLTIGQSDDIFQSARMSASAGALEIKTLKPIFEDGKKANVSAQMKIASFKTFNPSILYQQKLSEDWSLSLTGDWLSSDGTYPFTIQNGTETQHLTRENSDVERLRAELNLYGKLGHGNLSIKGNWHDSERGLPGSVVLYNTDAKERLWDRNAFANAHYESDLGEKWKIQGSLRYSYAWDRYIDVSEKYSGGMIEDCYTQQEYYASATALFAPVSKLHFTLAQDVFYNTLDATIPECRFPRRTSSLTALSGQWHSKRLTATASILGTLMSESVARGSAAPNRSHLSPSVSVSYKPFENNSLRVRASFRDGFRVPTFNDLYYARVGNTNLKPERALQYNAGVTWSDSQTKVTFDGYYNNVKDKIVAIPTLFIWKMRNMDRVSILGADLATQTTITLSNSVLLQLSGNYSYQYAVDVTDPGSSTYRHQIPYTPRHSGNLNATMMSKWVNVSYMINAVGPRYALPENVSRNLVEGYLEHSVSMGRDFDLKSLQLHLQGEVINLTNKQYAVIQYYPMPGRSYRLTLKVKI